MEIEHSFQWEVAISTAVHPFGYQILGTLSFPHWTCCHLPKEEKPKSHQVTASSSKSRADEAQTSLDLDVPLWDLTTHELMDMLSSLRPLTPTVPLQIKERITMTETSPQKKAWWRTHSNHWSVAIMKSDGTGIVRILFSGSWGISLIRPDSTCWWISRFFVAPGSPFWRFFHVHYPPCQHYGVC